MRRRLRKIFVVALSVVLGLWALWIVGANVALWTAPNLIGKREPVALSFKAFTVIPSIIHVRHFQLRVEDRQLQWSVEARRGTVRVDISSLFHRTFHARTAVAEGVKFKLRIKRTEQEIANAPTDAFPPIEGFGPSPVREDARFPEGLPLVNPWTIKMDDVTAIGDELWVEGVRYKGPAKATGRWQMTFDRAVDVGPVELAFDGGGVSFQGRPVAQALQGAVRGGLHPFNPREVLEGELIKQVRVLGALNGAIAEDVATRPSSEQGSFDATIDIDRGVMRRGTEVTAKVPGALMQFGAMKLNGNVDASIQVTPDNNVAWFAKGHDMRLSLPTRGGLSLTAPAATVAAQTSQTELSKLSLPTHAEVDLPTARISELKAVNALIPDPLKLNVQGGSGHVSAKLRVNVRERTAKGRVLARAQSLSVTHDGRKLGGDVAVRLEIAKAGPELERMSLGTARISFEKMTDGSGTAPWNGFVDLSRASINTHRKEVLRGHVTAQFSNARPLFRAIVEELDVPGWAKGAITPTNVIAEGDLALGRGLVLLKDTHARVGRVDVRTTVRLKKDEQRGVAELSMGKLRLGVERVGRRTQVRPFAPKDWYQRKRHVAGL